MAQFQVFRDQRNPHGPLLLDLQSGLIAPLTTRVVAPLYPIESAPHSELRGLNPTFDVKGAHYVMLTTQLSGIPESDLGESIADLGHERQSILSALDLLFTGI